MTAPGPRAGGGATSRVIRERHVLCVDDDPEFLKSLEFFLPERTNATAPEGLWYRFLFFNRPEDALRTLSELISEGETIAMLISDQKMPSMKGTELLSEARRHSARSIRVLLTGYAGIESAVLAINERLLDKYLTKPIEDQEGFAVSIQHLLQHFEMQELVERQSETIGELYRFSNELNACVGFDETLERIAAFAGRVLQCEQAFALVRDGEGRVRSARVGLREGVEGWLDLPLVPSPRGGNGSGDTWIRMISSPTDLAGEVWNVEEAIRQALRFPMLTVTLEADGEVLGMIGSAGRPTNQPFDEAAERNLSYIASTASIALRKLRAHERLAEAYRIMQDDARRLAEANQRLRILDQARAEFLSFISHELATPLSLMSGVQMLDEAPGAHAREAPLIQGLRRGYEQLKDFIEGGRAYFGWLSRVPTLSGEVTDLAAVVARLVEEAADSRNRIAFEPGPAPHLVRIPEEAARSVVNVLLQNAIKFSGENPEVTVTLGTSGDHEVLTVTDRGRGFPPGWAAEVLRPFAVADTLHHHRGSGLHLATAAAITAAYGGSIEASSAGWDTGATFKVRLPGERVPAARPAPDEAPGPASEDVRGAAPGD